MIHGEVPLAILPAGTANVLSVELGLGTRILRAAERLSELVPEKIAVGLLENSMERRHFLMMAGVGFDAMIVYNIDVALKQRIGRVAYWIAGFSQFGRALPEFDVRANGANGHVSRCSFALASRVRNYGGDLYIARGASLFSDQFELITFEGAHSVPYVKYLLGVITGRLASMKGVAVLRTEVLDVEAPSESSIYIQVDGEYAGRLPARISIVPGGITLLMPPDFRMKHTRQSNG
jgi:diacylglycerol kinase (ATP)